MSVTRRRVLAHLGATAGVLAPAGCLAPGDPGTDDTPSGGRATATTTPTGRRVAMGETIAVGATRMTVANPRVRKAVVTTGMAHTRVVAHAGQFVVADVLVDGDRPDARPANLDLWSVAAGERVPNGDPLGSLQGESGAYAFRFPAAEHDTAAIVHTGGESRVAWTLPAPVRETLAREPAFVVSKLRIERRDGDRVLEFPVTNEGAREGVFRARVSLDGFSGGSVVEFPVPAGESRTYTGRPGDILQYAENSGGGTITVEYPADDGLARVERAV